MKEAFEKIRFRLQDHCESGDCRKFCHECDFKTAFSIVSEVEAEYKDCSDSRRLWYQKGYEDAKAEYPKNIMDELLEAKKNCGEDSDCSQCPFGCEDGCRLQELQITGGNNGWIPCSERLPEAYDIDSKPILEKPWYLVSRECGSCAIVNYVTIRGKDMWLGNSFVHKDVIAWMPLPEPYKGEQ